MKLPFGYHIYKKKIFGLFLFGFLIVGLNLFFHFYKKNQKQENWGEIIYQSAEKELLLFEFDPNDLDENAWVKLGFSTKQAQVILKYKNIVGGIFKSKEQLKKCYAISDKKFSELEKYILLPEKNTNFSSEYKKYSKKEISIKQKFNPDNYSLNDWVSIGFSENQATAILKYKNYLGGSFLSKEKFKACFIISEENYQKIAPFLLLPEKENPPVLSHKEKKSTTITLQNFDPNTLDKLGWVNLGFSEKQAEVILNYKIKKLGGAFHSIEDIQSCFVISEKKFKELQPFIKIEERKTATPPTIKEFPSNENQIFDINQISFKQLVDFGFNEKSAGSFIGFRKKLGGFMDKKQILEVYHIDKNLAEKLIQNSIIETSNNTTYPSLSTAPESWLKNHPYFKNYADKIIFFRNSNPDDKKIWKFINPTNEQKQKMELYLK